MTIKPLLQRLDDEISDVGNLATKDDLELLPIYVNPESEVRRVREDDVENLKDLKRVFRTLTRFDLSDREIKVYLFLARFGAQKALTIAKSLDVHRTEIYKLLDSLESQGLVSRILERPLRFKASPLNKVLNNFIEGRRRRMQQLENNRDEVLEIWSNLPKENYYEVKAQTYQVLESKKQVRLKIRGMFRGCEQKFDMALKERDFIWLYKTTLFEELEKEISGRGLTISLLTDYSKERSYLPEGISIKGARICYIDNLNLPSFFLADDKEMILILDNGGTELSAMWTDYESLTKSYRILYTLFSNNIDKKRNSNGVTKKKNIFISGRLLQ